MNKMIHNYEFTHEQDSEAKLLRDYVLSSAKGNKAESISFFEFFGIENDHLSICGAEND